MFTKVSMSRLRTSSDQGRAGLNGMMDTAHCSCIVKIWAMLLLLLLLSQSKYSVYHILKSHADNGGDNLLLWTRWPPVEQHWGQVGLLLLRQGYFLA